MQIGRRRALTGHLQEQQRSELLKAVAAGEAAIAEQACTVTDTMPAVIIANPLLTMAAPRELQLPFE